jgi:hypothetical protein
LYTLIIKKMFFTTNHYFSCVLGKLSKPQLGMHLYVTIDGKVQKPFSFPIYTFFLYFPIGAETNCVVVFMYIEQHETGRNL